MTKIEKELNNSVLAELLGAKGIEELRSKLIDIICEEVRDQLQSSANYIVSPDDISNDLYEEIINVVKESVMEEYKEKILTQIEGKFAVML